MDLGGLTWPLLGALEPSAEQKPARDRGVRGSARRAHVAVPSSPCVAGAVAFKFSQRSGASGPCAVVLGQRPDSECLRRTGS